MRVRVRVSSAEKGSSISTMDHARVATLLEQVELASCADARPATLSGGMRQRAGVISTTVRPASRVAARV
jgi:ABC-type nitrate/sulfonate/bicarbonate transport system ATPase subunit